MNNSKRLSKRAFLCTTALGVVDVASSPAWALDLPSDPVVLTISGRINATNSSDTAVFSMRMLEALPQHSFATKTPWYPKAVEFTGPLLRDVLAAVGAKGSTVVAIALNDYKTEIPFNDATQHPVIVARLINGKAIPVRERGPLFIVYPFDSKPELATEKYYTRSAWQLCRLVVQ